MIGAFFDIHVHHAKRSWTWLKEMCECGCDTATLYRNETVGLIFSMKMALPFGCFQTPTVIWTNTLVNVAVVLSRGMFLKCKRKFCSNIQMCIFFEFANFLHEYDTILNIFRFVNRIFPLAFCVFDCNSKKYSYRKLNE